MSTWLRTLQAATHRHPVVAASIAATGLGLGALLARGGDAEGLEAALALGAVGAVGYAGWALKAGHPHASAAELVIARPRTVAALALGSAAAIELAAAHGRFRARERTHAAATARASALGRPLVVVGDPDNGLHTRLVRAYPCGDRTVDLAPSGNCPRSIAHDITSGPTPGVATGSAVVVCHCVLEYVSDPHAAWRELVRMAGDPREVFLVTVDVGSLTATAYPGARWTIARSGDGAGITATPVSDARKLGTVAAFLALGATAVL